MAHLTQYLHPTEDSNVTTKRFSKLALVFSLYSLMQFFMHNSKTVLEFAVRWHSTHRLNEDRSTFSFRSSCRWQEALLTAVPCSSKVFFFAAPSLLPFGPRKIYSPPFAARHNTRIKAVEAVLNLFKLLKAR
jgi:hypothetical protein